MKIASKIINKIRNLIKVATVSSVDDTQNIQFVRIDALGANRKCCLFFPYGHIGNPPTNSMGLVFQIQGMASKQFVIANDPNARIKNLAEGETGIANFLTGSYTIYREDGNIEVYAANDEIVSIIGNANVTVGGNATVTTIGNTTVNTTGNTEINTTGSTEVNSTGAMSLISDTSLLLKAPTVGIQANSWSAKSLDGTGTTSTSMDGDLTVNSGDISAPDGDVFASGISGNSHTHGGVTTGSDSTDGPE